MKNYFVYPLLLLLFIPASYNGQRHEVGVQLGMSNLVGDIGRTNYVLQRPALSNLSDYGIPVYASVLYRMNFNPYQTLRFNLGFSNIQFIDALAKEQYRRDRKLWGTNSMLEADVMFEYNFLPVNDEQKAMLSPYIFGGVGALYASVSNLIIAHDFKRDSSGNPIDPIAGDPYSFTTTPNYTMSKNVIMSIPFGVGLKYKFNYNWALFGEFMFRPTFSDAIDYSVVEEKNVRITYSKDLPGMEGDNKSRLQDSNFIQMAEGKAAKFVEDRQIGNINSKDWVNSISIGLSYSFGRPPCYCN